MRKLKSLVLIALSAFVITACSNTSREIEQASPQELYTKGQAYLQDGDYSQAIRYLDALKTRYPGSNYDAQNQLNLIYAYYKAKDYTKTLATAERFLQQYPNTSRLDYVVYMAGLTNFSMGENAFQDFFGIDRATREATAFKRAFANFQTVVQHFPNGPYAQDAILRMAYIKSSLARHELAIAKFYMKRNAYVAVANRVVGMLQQYPDTKATLEALPLMKEAYEKMNLTDLANKTQVLIDANKDKQFADVEKPADPEIALPSGQ
ncbi:outer membrane protein assembly factor BamD [Avibacterium avium]|uniref:outer membrane protein assembly factor BamD n=1 Tax=Avibacterium avium TaxID=751 RepID=UPI003BF85DA6